MTVCNPAENNGTSNHHHLNGLPEHLSGAADKAHEAQVCVTEDKQAMGSSDFILVDEDGERKRKGSVKAKLKELVPRAKERIRRGCTRKLLNKRLPILNWLPRYRSSDIVGDIVAGITVGLTVIPQSLAYARLAGLPTQYGLYGSFFGSMLYILFGSCKDVPMGPTAIVSLLTYQTVKGLGPEHAVLLCFLSGAVMVIMGILGLGFVIDFVSGPVSSGFTSAVAIIIVSSQVKDLLGIDASGNTFVEMWSSVFSMWHTTRLWDAVLGFICIVLLLLLRLVANIKIGPKEESERSTFHNIVNKLFWLVSTTRNATLVIATGAISYAFSNQGQQPFRIIGYIPPGLPDMKPPPFGYVNENNATVPFSEMVSNLGSGIIVLPIIALLENIAICKAFSAGKAIDATQEMLAIGLCNIGNSFVQAFPGTGALARSAVNNASGVRSPMGGLYTGAIVIASLLFFTPYFQFIPKCALAAMIIAAVVFMVEVRVVKPMWRCKKMDLIPCLGTFIFCLAIQLEIGIIVGIGINVLFILYQAARPKISMERLTTPGGVEFVMLTPDRCLIFPSVDYVRNLVTKQGAKQGYIPVVIDCSHIYGADFTAAKVVESLTNDFASRKQQLFFYNLKPSVVAVFEGLQPKQFVVYYNDEDLDNLLKERLNTV